MDQVLLRRVGLALVAGFAGFAVNSLPIGAGAPVLLGRVFTLPIAILFGPSLGALAAVLCGFPLRGTTFAIVAIIVLLVEALLVGVFARQHKSPLVAASFVWAMVALTMVAAPQIYGLGYQRQAVWPIALQMPLNGLVGVVLADLLVAGTSARRILGIEVAVEQRRLRTYAFHA